MGILPYAGVDITTFELLKELLPEEHKFTLSLRLLNNE